MLIQQKCTKSRKKNGIEPIQVHSHKSIYVPSFMLCNGITKRHMRTVKAVIQMIYITLFTSTFYFTPEVEDKNHTL